MNNWGIIFAMEEEQKAFRKLIVNAKQINSKIWKGSINNQNLILALSGIGKVNAALTTQKIIDNFNVNKIINCGSCGLVGKDGQIGDVILGEKTRYCDVDVTAFGYELGQLPMMPKIFSNTKITIKKKQNFKIYQGLMISGDIFLTKATKIKYSHILNKALGFDMESTAISQTCYINMINYSFIVKGIADIPDKNKNQIEFRNNLFLAATNAAKIAIEIIKQEGK